MHFSLLYCRKSQSRGRMNAKISQRYHIVTQTLPVPSAGQLIALQVRLLMLTVPPDMLAYCPWVKLHDQSRLSTSNPG